MFEITDSKIQDMINICGSNNMERFNVYELEKVRKILEKAGYIIFDYAWNIITNFYKISFGSRGVYTLTGYSVVELQHLKNRFCINPTMIKDEYERIKEIGIEFNDYLVPLGIYNGYYLVVGKSQKIYIIVPGVAIVGNNFIDFLCKYYNNEEPQWITNN